MPTCLVTGGAGFLGSHLCDELLARGHRVICVDNLETGSLANIAHIRRPEFVHLNLDIIEPYFVDEPIDFVYHLASPASPIDYLRLPLHTLKVGSYGTHHTLGLAKVHRARFLIASTSEVYGDPKVHPQPESYWGHVNPIGPRGVYDEAKRYAEALTMAYHRQQGVDTAIVRIFNSVLADEQVLYDDGFELRRETAEQAAARLATRALAAGYVSKSMVPAGAGVASAGFTPALEYPADGWSVPAFGSGGRMAVAPAAALIGHPTDERCFELRTAYGRSIRVTGHHSVFVEGPDGEPVAKPAEDLRVGDRIAIARRLEVPERDRTVVSMLEVWRKGEFDPWDITVEWPGLGAVAWEKRHDLFGLLASERRNAGVHWRNGAWTKIIRMRDTDRVPFGALRRLGVEFPPDARVRLVAEPNLSLPARIEITDHVLRRLGVLVAQASDVPVAEKLLRRLLEFLGFESGRSRIPGWILGLPLGRLKHFLEGYREGDGVHSGKTFEAGIRHEFSTTSEELKDDLVVLFARFGLIPSVGRYASRKGDREFPFWRLTLSHVSPWSPLEWDAGVTQRLQRARVHGDLAFVAVTGIAEIAPTELVYDFSVPGYENFVAGTGVVAKNTYGPRMRAHDGRAIPTFLRQALQNRPLTVFGDGSQTRSFCYVSDLVDGIIRLAESGQHAPVNVGNPDEFTLLELAQTVVEVTGSQSEIVFEALPTDDPQVRRPDISLAREVLGWQPTVALRDGLRRTIEGAGPDALIGVTT